MPSTAKCVTTGLLLAAFASTASVIAQSRTTCEGLAAVAIANTTVTLAQGVASGAFTPPVRGAGPGAPAA